MIVDDFGFKYTNKRHVDELLKIMSQWYVMKMDWPGTSFRGITLKWNYDSERWVELSLPGYIEKILARYRHPRPKIPQDSPHPAPPTKFTRTTLTPPSPDKSPLSRRKGNKEDTTNMQVYPVVHAGMRPNNNEGAERHWTRASKGRRTQQ